MRQRGLIEECASKGLFFHVQLIDEPLTLHCIEQIVTGTIDRFRARVRLVQLVHMPRLVGIGAAPEIDRFGVQLLVEL